MILITEKFIYNTKFQVIKKLFDIFSQNISSGIDALKVHTILDGKISNTWL